MANSLKGSAPNLGVRLSKLERTYALVSPLVFKGAHIVERLRGASREELQSRLGYVPVAGAPVIWFHGASAGEMAAAAALRGALRQGGHRFEPVYTATNRAGTDYIRRVEPAARAISLVPWDTRASIARAFDRWKPRALLIIETELWPLMVFEACERGIPVFSVSARIYPADVARYRAIRPFISRTLRRITRVLAQDENERRRFIEIGAPAERCLSVGNLKYIISRAEATNPDSLRAEIGLLQVDKVVVCGSIHADEAVQLLDALRSSLPAEVRVIVAPRHLSAVGAIERWAKQSRWDYACRSRRSKEKGWRLMILDTMGELSRFYQIGTCAIVGGGFKRHGGHNPFEPVRAGIPVLYGPHFYHFDSEARAIASVTPQAQGSDPAAISHVLALWLGDEGARAAAYAKQLGVLPDASAIAARYTSTLEPFLTAVGV